MKTRYKVGELVWVLVPLYTGFKIGDQVEITRKDGKLLKVETSGPGHRHGWVLPSQIAKVKR